MKIIALGDIHGKTGWEGIAKQEADADKIIFIGDYFDNPNIPSMYQIHNFKEICHLKKQNPDKVILLFGNHDYHYMRGITEHYSGYSATHAMDIQEVIHEALDQDLLQMCFLQDEFLFTHAGVTNSWCTKWSLRTDPVNIEREINDLFKYRPLAFKFTQGGNRSKSGDDICQTPIWVRPQSLLIDGLKDYTHVVGHTAQANGINKAGNVILIDTFETTQEYLRLTDGKREAVKCQIPKY